MQNANRLIDYFKRQTKATVWKHLNAVADNDAVYSTRLNGLSPFLTDYNTYLYCTATNVVIVCLDCCGHSEEHVYEENTSLSSLILSDGMEPRTSVVWKMDEAVRLSMIRLHNSGFNVNVYGVLLTEAEIVNSEELEELWDAHNVMVIDGFTSLKYRTVRLNEDNDLNCRKYMDAIIDTSFGEPVAEEPVPKTATAAPNLRENAADLEDDDDFARLLDKFLNEGMEIVDDEAPSDIPFPDGEIEQNQNISVKVEILCPVANPREELDKLVGCADIKRRMDELVALTSYNKMMRNMFPNGKQHEVSLHSVFLGRPGTGKTTVCKIFGSLLRQAGALSKGHVVVCDRGTFIGTLWGDEDRAMRQVLEMAKGGVLMIDEAYLLNGKHENDPGKLVIQLMMNILADETQRDIAIVLCGYKEPMMKMLDMNPGLLSRFPNKFEFTDFSVDELLEITRRRIEEYNYRFTTEAWDKYRDMLTQAYQVRDPETWGNARFVSNQLERIYIQHASRCVRQHPQDRRDLLMLTPEDIVPIEIPRQRAKIGF